MSRNAMMKGNFDRSRFSMQYGDTILIVLFIAVWLALQLWILPKLGLST
ncbi:MAG: hypothetical protein WAO20_14005 [Acidobacteriota bacterium]